MPEIKRLRTTCYLAVWKLPPERVRRRAPVLHSDDDVVQRLAAIIDDYREWELCDSPVSRINTWADSVCNVCTWIDPPTRVVLLEALVDAMSVGYWSRERTRAALWELDRAQTRWPDAPDLMGDGWTWLDTQGPAASQSAMLEILPLQQREASTHSRHFAYLDDGLFSGGTVLTELRPWILDQAPRGARLLIAHLVSNAERIQMIRSRLSEWARPRKIDIQMITALSFSGASQPELFGPTVDLCLRPTRSMYEHSEALSTYRRRFGWQHREYKFETEPLAWNDGVFRSPEHRRVITRALLEVGCKIMMWSRQPSRGMRPLGFDEERTFGVGAMMATFHNAPNSAPLALWWGNPSFHDSHPLSRWTPLLPRRPAPASAQTTWSWDDDEPF